MTKLGDGKTLDDAIAAARNDAPAPGVADAAAARVWSRLAAELRADPAVVDHIRGCDDVVLLLPDHRDGRLTGARALLVQDHLKECAACRARLEDPSHPRLTVVPWRPASPAATPVRPGRPARHWLGVAAALLATVASAELLRRTVFAVPAGPRATVESLSGQLYRVAAAGPIALRPGEAIGESEVVRTATGARAGLRLRDGSLVEMGERAELAVRATRKDLTIDLDRGRIIVQAARRTSGRLLVASRDCTVQVTGTVFSVNSGLKGSRVSVIEGHVRVRQGAEERSLEPGDQFTSSDAIERVALRDEIAWSRDLDRHLALLAEVQALRQKWQGVRTPGLRYESRLLGRLPEGTVLFASLPNYGEALGQAHRLFEERLQESAVLREWWQQADPSRSGGPTVSSIIEAVRAFSEFLGDEIALAVVDGPRPRVVLLAEVRRPGLQEFLDQELAHVPTSERRPLHIQVTSDLVVVGDDAGVLSGVIGADGASAGFAATPLGQRVAAAYQEGVGLFFAADLERVRARHPGASSPDAAALRASGLDGLRYVVVENKTFDDQPQSRAAFAFAGPRRGVASWLAAPAPMGALDFFSPQAQAVGAVVAKSPALVLDDVLALAQGVDGSARAELERAESALDLHLRDDVAAALGGEFAAGLDGPMLPLPSWKVVVEVTDADRLQASLQALATRASEESVRHGRPALRLDADQVDGRTCYAVRGAGLPIEVHYTYADGYLVAAPSRALVLRAVQARATGNNLGQSEDFRSRFPRDGESHVSALLYQDLGRSMRSLLDAAPALSSEQRGAIEALAHDARPTLFCAYGEEQSIRIAAMGGLLDFDPSSLALPALLERALPGTPRVGNP
jgi:ferric-dicitrate binding protein FerR (iron transport regulator)